MAWYLEIYVRLTWHIVSNILINSLVDIYLTSSDQYFSYIEMAEQELP